jgi:hypothetical protein
MGGRENEGKGRGRHAGREEKKEGTAKLGIRTTKWCAINL